LQYVNKDKSESVVFVYNLAEYPDYFISETKRSKEIKLRGLQADAKYKIDSIENAHTGQFLMEKGIVLPLSGSFKSKIFKITKQ
jgi:alpha-galactosidase